MNFKFKHHNVDINLRSVGEWVEGQKVNIQVEYNEILDQLDVNITSIYKEKK